MLLSVKGLVHRWCIGALGLTATVFDVDTANACGATGDVVSNYLPTTNAEDVPLDAALLAGSNRTGMVFSLRRANDADIIVADGGAALDAGALEPLIITTCRRTEGGELCVAKPAESLEPNTRYEWKVEIPGSPYVAYSTPNGNTVNIAEWHSFTTGTAKLGNEGAGTVQASVIRNERTEGFVGNMCGWPASATLRFSGTDLTSPLLIALAGFTPSNQGNAMLIDGQQPLVELTISGPPDCVLPEIYDVTGQRRVLDTMCLEELLPATVTVVADPSAPTAGTITTTAPDTAPTMSVQSSPVSPIDDGDSTPRLNAAEPAGSEGAASCGVALSPRGSAPWPVFALLGAAGAFRVRSRTSSRRNAVSQRNEIERYED